MKLSKIQNWTLYLFFFSINFEVWDPFNTGGVFSLYKLFGIIYILTILPRLNHHFLISTYKLPLVTIWFFFSWLTVISLLHLNNYSSAFFDFSFFLNIIFYWIVISHIKNDNRIIDKGFIFYAFGSILLSLFYYLGYGVSIDIDGRQTLFGDNENIVGMRMSVSLLILIYLIFINELQFKKFRFLLILAIPLMLSLMMQTGSRTALLSLALMLITFVLLIKSNITFKIGLLFSMIALAYFAWTQLVDTHVLFSRLLRTANEGNIAGREDIWKYVTLTIKENPLIGIGQTGYVKFATQKMGEYLSPHNVFLEILAYSGLVGLSIFLYFIFLNISNSLRYYRKTGSFILFILLIPILGIMMSGQLLNSKIAWMIFAFATSKSYLLSRNEKAT